MQSTKHSPTYLGKVLRGDQTGRTINYPTINLDPQLLPATTQPGVYASRLELDDQNLIGALYFGPRLVKGETHNVLEIYILDFDQDVYDAAVRFSLDCFIRPVVHFGSLAELQKQLAQDVEDVRTALPSHT